VTERKPLVVVVLNWNHLYTGVHPMIRIPGSLITGPFDLEMARRLFWLRCNGANFTKRENWELTKEGFDNIMRLDDDELAFHLVRLFNSWGVLGSRFWPAHVRKEAVAKLDAQLANPENKLRKACMIARIFLLNTSGDPALVILPTEW
jgi:hypothetical protein